MAYSLTTSQQATVSTLKSQGDYAAAYQYIRDVTQSAVDNGDIASSVNTWFGVAAQINANSGSYLSNYVRRYTKNAGAFNNQTISDQDFQDASDELARKVLDLILNNGGLIPTAEQIIQTEVDSIVQEFGLQNEDWAGTFVSSYVFGFDALAEYVFNDAPAPQESIDFFKVLFNTGISGVGALFGSDSDGDNRADGINGSSGGSGGGGNNGGYGPQLPPGGLPDNQKSPLVIDLDGDGIETYAVGDYGTYFDLEGLGQAFLTGWVEPDDGLLAVDLNDNGVIDDIDELFGDKVTDGFTALASYDSNSDGVVNASDTNFGDLLIWTDINSDGISQETELFTLDDFNITEINLDATRVNIDSNGNTITHTSTVTINGVAQDIVDVWFGYDPTNTRNALDFNIDYRAYFLPTLRGYGELKDIHIAASLDNGTDPGTLIEQLISFVDGLTIETALDNWAITEAAIDDMLLRWADVEAVNPTGRGSYVDGQHLAFYEAFRGYAFNQDGSANPLPEAGEFVEAIYENIKTIYAMQLIAQIDGAQIFDDYNYSLYTGGIEGDMNLQQSGIDAIEAAAVASSDPVALWTRFAQFIGYTKGLDNLTAAEVTALDSAVYDTGEPSLSDWQDVVNEMTASLGGIIDSPDDWGSFEMVYDNPQSGTSSGETITDAYSNSNSSIDGKAGDDTLEGLDGHDKLIGGDGNDTLDGGTGDDFMLGGDGDDIYLYESGNDTISEEGGSGTDELHIVSSTGLTQSNLTDLYRYGDDLMILLDTGDYITVHNYNDTNAGLEKIVFDYDSSEIDLTALLTEKFYGTSGFDNITAAGQQIQTLLAYGYEGNDTITVSGAAAEFYGGDGYDTLTGDFLADELYGDDQDDLLIGNDGDDELHGGNDNDHLIGGNDADSLYGEGDNDRLDGGAGDDYLNGGGQSDTYIFGLGYGSDTIGESGTSSGDDRVLLGAGITTADVVVSRGDGHDILLSIDGTTDSLLLDNQEFYTTGAARIENIVFDDGTIWDAEDLRLKSIANASTSGDDTIYGFKGEDDTLDGGTGNDTLNGDKGDDTYIFGLGYGQDTISEGSGGGGSDQVLLGSGITTADVIVSRGAGDDILLSIDGTTDTLLLNSQEEYSGARIEKIVFADTTEWTAEDLRLKSIETSTTDGDDTIKGFEDFDDVLEGGLGNDTMIGDRGDDTYIYNLGDGQDTIIEERGDDTVAFGAGISVYDLRLYEDASNDLVIEIGSAASSITVQNFYSSGWYQVETFEFADSSVVIVPDSSTVNGTTGNDIVLGTDADETLNGDAGSDLILAGAGSDTISGGAGTDSFVIASAASVTDTITDFDTSGETIDLTAFNGVFDSFGELQSAMTQVSADTHIDLGGSQTLILENVTATNLANTNFFGDAGNLAPVISNNGASVDEDTVLTLTTAMLDGSDGDNTDNELVFTVNSVPTNGVLKLSGATLATNDTFTVQDITNANVTYTPNMSYIGNDSFDFTLSDGTASLAQDSFAITVGPNIIDGTSGDDTLNGTSGKDIISGFDGNDTISGSDGDDLIYGGLGDDVIDGGNGVDTLSYENATAAVYVYLQNSNSSGGEGSDTLSNIEDVVGSDYADKIHGNSDDNTLYGGAGNDKLYSHGGNDVLYGGAGVDSFFIFNADSVTIYGDNSKDYIYVRNEALGGTKIIYGEGASDDEIRYVYVNSFSISIDIANGTIDEQRDGTDELTFYDVERFRGTKLNDEFLGASSDDFFYAVQGDDIAYGGAGLDQLDGGAGDDILYGDAGDDKLYGSSGDDLLYGGDGDDLIKGNWDNDTIYGGDGLDTLWGQTGADTFVFENASAFNDIDIVEDFDISTDNDVLDISDILDNTSYVHGTDPITDWVEIKDSGSDSVVKVDTTGSGTFGAGTQIATLEDITGLTDEAALVTSGNLIVS